jgi:DNA-binding transcriptional ArsR family regulator
VVNSQATERLDRTFADDRLGRVFAAMSDRTRRTIVADLARHGGRTSGELAAPHEMSLPAVSKHLAVLERAGLVSRTRQGRNQVYTLRPQQLSEAAQWLDRHHRFWTERLDALTDYLEDE